MATTGPNLENVSTKLMDGGVRSPEAAERLGIDGADAYRMLFEGELDGGPGTDGMVYFDEASLHSYLERHGFGVVAGASTALLLHGTKQPMTGWYTSSSRKRTSKPQPGTRRDRTNRRSSGS